MLKLSEQLFQFPRGAALRELKIVFACMGKDCYSNDIYAQNII